MCLENQPGDRPIGGGWATAGALAQCGGWPAAGGWATAGGLVTTRDRPVLDGERLILIDLLFLLVADWPIFCFRLPGMSASQSTNIIYRSCQ